MTTSVSLKDNLTRVLPKIFWQMGSFRASYLVFKDFSNLA